MKRLIAGFILLAVCFPMPATACAVEELAEGEYTAGEKFLQKSTEEHCKIYRLWPGDGTRADDPFKGEESKKKWLERVSAPSMIVVRPEKPDGRAVVLFPGGAYRFLAAGHEGVDVAKWLASSAERVQGSRFRGSRLPDEIYSRPFPTSEPMNVEL